MKTYLLAILLGVLAIVGWQPANSLDAELTQLRPQLDDAQVTSQKQEAIMENLRR